MKSPEHVLSGLILECSLMKSGQLVPIYDIQRYLSRRAQTPSVSRIRQAMNHLIDLCQAESSEMPNGELYYRAASQWRARLAKPWANVPAECQHTPRWF